MEVKTYKYKKEFYSVVMILKLRLFKLNSFTCAPFFLITLYYTS